MNYWKCRILINILKFLIVHVYVKLWSATRPRKMHWMLKHTMNWLVNFLYDIYLQVFASYNPFALLDALQGAASDDSVSIVALTGEGDFYSSGNDISKFLKVTDPRREIEAAYTSLKSLILAFCSFPKLLVCVVNGPCIGISATTAVLCDIIYATDSVSSTLSITICCAKIKLFLIMFRPTFTRRFQNWDFVLKAVPHTLFQKF